MKILLKMLRTANTLFSDMSLFFSFYLVFSLGNALSLMRKLNEDILLVIGK